MKTPLKLPKKLLMDLAGCDTLDDFRTYMTRRGIWMNENAAKEVFSTVIETEEYKLAKEDVKQLRRYLEDDIIK